MLVERPGTLKQRQALLKQHYELMVAYVREGFTREDASAKAYADMFPYKRDKKRKEGTQ